MLNLRKRFFIFNSKVIDLNFILYKFIVLRRRRDRFFLIILNILIPRLIILLIFFNYLIYR